MIATGLIEAGDKVSAARASGARADCEATGELCLTLGGKRGALLMLNTNPLDRTAANRVGQRIQRIAD
jgi:hypothetical protein